MPQDFSAKGKILCNACRNPNAPGWWRDARLSSELEEFEIDRSTPTPTERVHIWIDQKSRTVYASRDVID